MPSENGSPGTVTETNDFGNGVESWANIDNVKLSDDSRASVKAGDISFSLHCENFGFNIPAGATINSITVEVEGRTTLANTNQVYHSRLLKGGMAVGNFGAMKDLSDADTVLDISPLGDPLWGSTWTAAEINAIDFGVTLNVNKTLV